jgi:hypothetical protein
MPHFFVIFLAYLSVDITSLIFPDIHRDYFNDSLGEILKVLLPILVSWAFLIRNAIGVKAQFSVFNESAMGLVKSLKSRRHAIDTRDEQLEQVYRSASCGFIYSLRSNAPIIGVSLTAIQVWIVFVQDNELSLEDYSQLIHLFPQLFTGVLYGALCAILANSYHDRIERLGAEYLRKFDSHVNEHFSTDIVLDQAMLEHSEELKKWVSEVSGTLSNFLQSVASLPNSLEGLHTELNKSSLVIADSVRTFQKSMEDHQTEQKLMVSSFREQYQETGELFKDMVSEFKKEDQSMMETFRDHHVNASQNYLQAHEKMIQEMESFSQKWTSPLDESYEKFQELCKSLNEDHSQKMTEVVLTANKNGIRTNELLECLQSSIKENIEQVQSGSREMLGHMHSGVEGMVDTINSTHQIWNNSIGEVSESMVQLKHDLFQESKSQHGETIEKLLQTQKNALELNESGIRDLAGSLGDLRREVLDGIRGSATDLRILVDSSTAEVKAMGELRNSSLDGIKDSEERLKLILNAVEAQKDSFEALGETQREFIFKLLAQSELTTKALSQLIPRSTDLEQGQQVKEENNTDETL